MGEVIWEGNSFEIASFDDDCIAFSDRFNERNYFVWWNKEEALSLADAIQKFYKDKENEVKFSEVIWDTDIMEVTRNEHGLLFMPVDDWDGIEEDEITAFCRYWLTDFAAPEREPVIAPCPFCGDGCLVERYIYSINDDAIFGNGLQVVCLQKRTCGYRGPYANTPNEAIRLHNELKRV